MKESGVYSRTKDGNSVRIQYEKTACQLDSSWSNSDNEVVDRNRYILMAVQGILQCFARWCICKVSVIEAGFVVRSSEGVNSAQRSIIKYRVFLAWEVAVQLLTDTDLLRIAEGEQMKDESATSFEEEQRFASHLRKH